MPDIANIRKALAANLADTLDGVQVSPWTNPNPVPPALHILGLQPIDYDETFNGDVHTIELVVQGVSQNVESVAGQEQFAEWTSTGSTVSVKYAIESNRTLTSRYVYPGGSITTGQTALSDALRVTRYNGDQFLNINGNTHVVGEWVVQIDVST